MFNELHCGVAWRLLPSAVRKWLVFLCSSIVATYSWSTCFELTAALISRRLSKWRRPRTSRQHPSKSLPSSNLWSSSYPIVGRVAQSVLRLATGWTVRGSNPVGGEIFRTCTDRPWGSPSPLYNGYRVFPGVKRGRGVTLTPHPLLVPWSWRSRAVPLFPYGPYGLYWASVPVQWWPLPLPTFHIQLQVIKLLPMKQLC